MMRVFWPWVVILLFSAPPVLAKPTQRCFIGYAYSLDSGQLAYTETHHQTLENNHLTRANVIYRDSQGHTIAVKNMNFSNNRYVPVYRLKISGEGYVEGIRHGNGGWLMYRQEHTDANPETESFEVNSSTAGDSGFDPFVKAHFNALMNGKTVQFSFAVAGRLSVISMKAERIGDTTFQGQPAIRIKAELNMFLINWFVDPIILIYDPNTKRLLEYKGISNMHGPDGEPYKVRVSYYSKPPSKARHAAAYCSGADE